MLATAVGGNPELIEPGRDGNARAAGRRRKHGARHARVCGEQFGLEAMVNAYMKVYDDMPAGRKWTSPVDRKTR